MFSKVLKMTLVALLLQGAAAVALARHHHHRNADTAPGEFDYYLLSLSWSPAFCLQQPDSPECSGPRRFGFIVHGLWPQNERGWPQNCGGGDVPDSVVAALSDLMPAKKLIDHEWTTHGTCSGLDPQGYFDLVRKARNSVTVPASFQNPSTAIQQPPSAIVDAFMQANPRLPADSVVATCSRQGAPRLREVHVCLDKTLGARACSADSLKEACRADSVIVPPVR